MSGEDQLQTDSLPHQNTDREIWRKVPGDYYSPYISVSADNEIIICVGGKCYQAPVGVWFELMRRYKKKNKVKIEG